MTSSLVAAQAPAVQSPPTTDRAIIVGISRYPGLTPLEGPEHDAAEFADWLCSDLGGQLPKANIDLVLSSQFAITDDILSAEPVVSTVDRKFRQLVELGRYSADGTVGQRLTIFLAGHGFTRSRSQAALLTAEAREEDAGFHIPGQAYADSFVQSGFFKEVVLYMDSCADSRTDVPMREVPWSIAGRAYPKANLFYGFAASWGQLARERRFPNHGHNHGVFSKLLLDGLAGAAANRTGLITTTSLSSYVRDESARLQTGTRLPQEPEFLCPRPFTLATSADVPQYEVEIRCSGWPSVEVTGAEIDVIIEPDGYGSHWRRRLPRGLYRVRETDGERRSRIVEVPNDTNQPLQIEDLFRVRR